MKTRKNYSRRQFLAGGLTLVGIAFGATRTAGARSRRKQNGVKIYRLSLRGRRGSNAARCNAANMRFATLEAAESGRAHSGDRSVVRQLVVSKEEYLRLFFRRAAKGHRFVAVADLRQL
jgi:hypothetical protein